MCRHKILSALPQYASRPSIHIDEDDAVTINEFQPIDLSGWVIFRTQILHPAHARHNICLNLAQGFDLACSHILPRIILLTPARIGRSGAKQSDAYKRRDKDKTV
jgi:hypothetical protein